MNNKPNIMAISSLFIKLLVAMLFTTISSYHATAQDVDFDSLMQEYDMVNIQDLCPEILVELKYSTEDNFVGKDMYGNLEIAYLEKEFANRVVLAQKLLKQRNPHYTLLIYDAARPISVQRTMHKIVKGSELEQFVADGTRGGRHNFGVAVDLTIATCDGQPLDMGAGFDDFTDAASVKSTADNSNPATRTIDIYRQHARWQVDNGIITSSAAKNRILLLEVMCEAGLFPYRREWWHYEDIISMDDVRKKYQLLDF